MNLILITKAYANHYNTTVLSEDKDLLIIINNLNYLQIINKLNTIKDLPVFIYDITTNNKTKSNQTKSYNVIDHINISGSNPLVGHQQHIQQPFFDISDLYTKQQQHHHIITHGLGDRYEKEKHNFTFPSTYLCHLAIIARATGKKNISAFLTSTQ